MAINNQATLRTAVADWLNRTDLSNDLIDTFIEVGEAKVYETLRVPTLEILSGFSVTEDTSAITLPSGFTELIELRKIGEGTCSVDPTNNTTRILCVDALGVWTNTSKDDDFTLRRVDGHTFHNNRLPNAFARELGNLLLTNEEGLQKASGEYVLKYYKAGDPIGTRLTKTAGDFVIGSSYNIVTVGDTDFTLIGAATNTVGLTFTATGVGVGTGTASVETVPWILGTEYEVILFAALAVGAIYLGDFESQQKFDLLSEGKVMALNDKTKKADLKGGIFTSNYSSGLL